ncbi:MAG: hypothetical protein OXG90_09710 [Gammaproteobacteria bacterium]|nr:hypothetical protein [Gammaproteobacteria bacterium]MCY3689241.1 hypothetical protein [Gammaproteobacteria bacterium]
MALSEFERGVLGAVYVAKIAKAQHGIKAEITRRFAEKVGLSMSQIYRIADSSRGAAKRFGAIFHEARGDILAEQVDAWRRDDEDAWLWESEESG